MVDATSIAPLWDMMRLYKEKCPGLLDGLAVVTGRKLVKFLFSSALGPALAQFPGGPIMLCH